MKKFLALLLLPLFLLAGSVPAANAAPPAVLPVVASDTAELVLTLVPARVVAGEEAPPEAFPEPVEVAPQPGDPVVFGPDTVYVEASDGSLVPESELAGYEAWLAEGNEAPVAFEEPVEVAPAPGDPVTFNPGEGDWSVASDGSLVPTSELAAHEAWLAEGNALPSTCG